MTTMTADVTPGWYPCPQHAGLLRLHDGTTWTTATAPMPTPGGAPVGVPTQRGQAPQQAHQPAHPQYQQPQQPAPDGGQVPVPPQLAPTVARATKRQPGRQAAPVRPTVVWTPDGVPLTMPSETLADAAVLRSIPTQRGPRGLVPRPAGPARPARPADPRRSRTGPRSVVHWLVPVGRSGVSIAAGYVGLVSLVVWVVGPLAVWLGVQGLRRARAGHHGSIRSWFAVVAGVLAVAAVGLLGVLLLTYPEASISDIVLLVHPGALDDAAALDDVTSLADLVALVGS